MIICMFAKLISLATRGGSIGLLAGVGVSVSRHISRSTYELAGGGAYVVLLTEGLVLASC